MVVQDLATQWIQSYPCKTKLPRKRRGACKSSWSQRGNQKSLTLTILQKLANIVKIFPGIILRQHRTDRKLMGLLREQCAESRKGHLRCCCNQVWTKNGGRIPGNAAAICDGKTPCERRFGAPFDGPIIPFGAMVDATASVRPKSLARHFPWICVARGEIWKGDILVADIEQLEQMDASEIHAKRLNAKAVSTLVSGEKFIFPIADGTAKLSAGDQVLRTSTLILDRPDPGEEHGNLRGIRRVFFNPTSRLIVVSWMLEMISVHFRQFLFTDITWNPESNCACGRRIISYSTEIYRLY